MGSKKSDSQKNLANFLLAGALPFAEQGSEDSTALVNIYSQPTNRINPSLEKLPNCASTHFDIGSEIAGYELIVPLHRSSRSEVFYANELDSRRQVVIKRFSERDQEQFTREKAIQKILKENGGHKNLLLADEFLDEERIIISPYAKGGDLFSLQERVGNLTPRQTRTIILGLCDALDYLHERGIVHRDVKTKNVVLDIDSTFFREIKSLFFGEITAQQLESSQGIVPKLFDYEMGRHESIADLAAPGIVVGTSYYVAPEAIKGEKCDLRLDIYALGVTLYELLAGRYPFTGNNDVQVLLRHTDTPVPDITKYNPAVTKDLQQVIEKALAKDPDERYESARELKRDYLGALS